SFLELEREEVELRMLDRIRLDLGEARLSDADELSPGTERRVSLGIGEDELGVLLDLFVRFRCERLVRNDGRRFFHAANPGGRIDRQPAEVREPDLDPCMRLKVADIGSSGLRRITPAAGESDDEAR